MVAQSPTTQSPEPESQLPSSDQLEAQQARIGQIFIAPENVFATDTPEENKALFRVANRLHVKTREDTIRKQLLFKSGDLYLDRLMRESERILRGNRYLFDATIRPLAYHDGVVDIEVRTKDVWTFKPGISYGRAGGQNTSGVELQESNLLGYGSEITLAHKNDVDRTSDEIRYFDPHLIDGRTRGQVAYSINSDGRQRSFFLDHPFYSLDTRWSAVGSAFDWLRTDQRYLLGHIADEFRHDQDRVEVGGGFSPGWQEGWIKRFTYGAVYADDRFASTGTLISAQPLPQDHRFAYPYIGFAFFQDEYERRRNEDQIERTEDLYTGSAIQARIGWADKAFGSTQSEAILSLSAGTTLEYLERRHTIVLQSDASSRLNSGSLENALVSGSARYFWRLNPRQLFYAALSGSATRDLDAEKQLTLGGDNGLRGYPLRYQEGTSAALLTLEHRFYTKYYLFRIFHVGGATFFDAGRTWGRGPAATAANVDTNLGMLKDVGFGLRFGSSRSAFGNVIHVDLAFPLDGDPTIKKVQFVVETKASF